MFCASDGPKAGTCVARFFRSVGGGRITELSPPELTCARDSRAAQEDMGNLLNLDQEHKVPSLFARKEGSRP